MSFFGRLKEGLAKTRQGLVEKIGDLVAIHNSFDEEFYEELEAILIQGDVGVENSLQLVEKIRERVKQDKLRETGQVYRVLQEEITLVLAEGEQKLNLDGTKPAVIMVVGVNGAGKTTTIGKLAYMLRQEGRKVLLAAGDTFRAAAIDQLEIWAQRVGVPIIKHQTGSDPAAVAFDAIQAGKSRGIDVIIIDTAGRLQTKVNLMAELKKMRKVIEREIGEPPQEVLLVLDATTGQNAISQAELFHEAVGVTAIALTKLDGTAKGGVIVAVKSQLGIPVKLVGIGEKVDDLRPFDASQFVEALFAAGPG